MKRIETHEEFETIAREFLTQHPEIKHEWKKISEFLDSRTDLVCESRPNEGVFATLRSWQIVIGTENEDTDFEDFGRGLSDREVALEAFALFVDLLRRKGLLVQGHSNEA